MNRRTFLAAAPAAAIASKEALSASLTPRSVDVYGVQLYTLREELAADLDRTLALVAEIGYREVEFAGLYGRTPREMRAVLDGLGLRAASSHHGVNEVRESWGRALESAQELGQSLIVVPGIPGSERSAEGLRRIADDFTRAGHAAVEAGLRFGYHNHSWEFEPLPDGTVPMDLLLERTDADVVDWQMDIFWTVDGGADPAAYMERTAGRISSIHLKDRTAAGAMVDVGDGVIDFAPLIALAERQGLRHAFVEHDQPSDAIDSIRRSLRHLKSISERP